MAHAFGLSTYRFGNEDGKLIVEWSVDETTPGQQESGIGLATATNGHTPGEYEGEYDVEAWRGKEKITRKLTIAKVHNAYQLTWAHPDEPTVYGYGFVSGDMLVVGFGKYGEA